MAASVDVSVVIPTFNREGTIGRALASVLGQTSVPREIIVVDDGSSDNTEKVVKQFDQVRFVKLPVNGGAARARNEGVRLAQSEFIAFLDSDDMWSSNKLEVQLSAYNDRPDAGLICTGVTVVERGDRIRYHAVPAVRGNLGWSAEQFQSYVFSTPTWLARRSTLIESGLFDEDLPNSEDFDMLFRMQANACIEVVNEPLVVKYNGVDSLDADLSRLESSYKILFARYPEEWRRSPRAKARCYTRLGAMNIRAGRLDQARKAILQAFFTTPWQPKIWVMYLMTFMGSGCYQRVRRAIRA